ncbi:hypothetical protein O6H91_04G039300 [Diphasiastrum complanatum]|uniref:Uncharacterized protein n=1 Tax=Diphasiastrum complanatum TaxID=34168 RepID=A0ACC2DWA9_DIPCM|nr:hypothetical protein O6H91_04G039300 [Diphasiastrum complanatum]
MDDSLLYEYFGNMDVEAIYAPSNEVNVIYQLISWVSSIISDDVIDLREKQSLYKERPIASQFLECDGKSCIFQVDKYENFQNNNCEKILDNSHIQEEFDTTSDELYQSLSVTSGSSIIDWKDFSFNQEYHQNQDEKTIDTDEVLIEDTNDTKTSDDHSIDKEKNLSFVVELSHNYLEEITLEDNMIEDGIENTDDNLLYDKAQPLEGENKFDGYESIKRTGFENLQMNCSEHKNLLPYSKEKEMLLFTKESEMLQRICYMKWKPFSMKKKVTIKKLLLPNNIGWDMLQEFRKLSRYDIIDMYPDNFDYEEMKHMDMINDKSQENYTSNTHLIGFNMDDDSNINYMSEDLSETVQTSYEQCDQLYSNNFCIDRINDNHHCDIDLDAMRSIVKMKDYISSDDINYGSVVQEEYTLKKNVNRHETLGQTLPWEIFPTLRLEQYELPSPAS